VNDWERRVVSAERKNVSTPATGKRGGRASEVGGGVGARGWGEGGWGGKGEESKREDKKWGSRRRDRLHRWK